MVSTTAETTQRPRSKQTPEKELVAPELQHPLAPIFRGALALSDQAVVSITTLLTMILVSRNIPEQLTVYALAWTALSFFKVAHERMLGAPYMVFAHEPKRDKAAFLGSSLTQHAIFGIASAGTLATFVALIRFFPVPAGTADAFIVVAMIAPFILLRDHVRVICSTHYNYLTSLTISITAFVIQIGGVLLAYRLGYLSVPLVFGLMGVASLLPSAIWLFVKPKPYRFSRQRIVVDWQKTWNYSKWLVAARSFPTAAACLLPWIVLWQVDEPSAGIFASCCTLVNVSMMFMIGINNYYQPRTVKALVSSGKAAMCRVLLEAVFIFTVVLSGFCVIFFLFGEQLLVGIFGPELSGNATVVCVLGIYMLIVGYSIVAGNGMAALERPRGLFFGEVAFGVVTIALAWWLSPVWGLVGTSLALVAGALASTVIAVSTFMYLLTKIAPTEEQQASTTNCADDASLTAPTS